MLIIPTLSSYDSQNFACQFLEPLHRFILTTKWSLWRNQCFHEALSIHGLARLCGSRVEQHLPNGMQGVTLFD